MYKKSMFKKDSNQYFMLQSVFYKVKQKLNKLCVIINQGRGVVI